MSAKCRVQTTALVGLKPRLPAGQALILSQALRKHNLHQARNFFFSAEIPKLSHFIFQSSGGKYWAETFPQYRFEFATLPHCDRCYKQCISTNLKSMVLVLNQMIQL